MANLSLKIKAEELGKSLDNLASNVENEIKEAVRDLSHAAYAKISADVQSKVSSQDLRQEYLKSLDIHELGGDSYLITLEGNWANKIEDGYESYDMRDTLLTSNKTVSVGSRAGQPWVQSKETGGRFAHVPISRQPFSKAGGDLAGDIKKLTAQNREGLEQRLTKVFNDASGRAIQGKVAVAKSDNPLIDRLTKYQNVTPDSVQSIYINYRTISDDGQGWYHPGHNGYKFFEDAERWVEEELENIIGTLL